MIDDSKLIQFFFRKVSFFAKRRIHKVRLCEIRIGRNKSLARLSGDEVPGSRAAAVNGTRKPQGVSRDVTVKVVSEPDSHRVLVY